jgi:hypothetical protein
LDRGRLGGRIQSSAANFKVLEVLEFSSSQVRSQGFLRFASSQVRGRAVPENAENLEKLENLKNLKN